MEQVIESRIQLFSSLSEAAELEHNLMCLYLYAALALKRGTDEGLSEKQVEAVTRWRKSIMAVALEEMTHLSLVANLIAACGGSLNFMRPNFPVSPGYYPADIVVELAPFDMSTLEHFIYLERPENRDLADGPSFHHAAYHRTAPRHTLMPHAADYTTVGELYRSIRNAIESLCDAKGEQTLFTGSKTRQLGPLDAPLPGIALVTDRASALAALDTIVVQGEGAQSVDGSHFAKFSAIRDEYVQLLAEDPGFVPGRNVARNPVMRSPTDPEHRVWVRAPLAARYMDLANTLYAFMLRSLVQVYAVEHRPAASKRALVECSVDAMHALSTVAETLTHLDANEDGDVKAGISFAMVRSLAPLEADVETTLMTERLAEIEQAFVDLQHDIEGEAGGPIDICIPALVRAREQLGKCRERLQANPYVVTTVAVAPPPPASKPAPAPVGDLIPGKRLSIRYDTKRCIHARYCVTEMPKVFKANTPGDWIYPDEADPDQLAVVLQQCTSGALGWVRHDGGFEEVVPQVNMIRIRENGPYAIHADLQGDLGYRAVFCRCGKSKHKPLCDGSHNDGFVATGEPATVDNTALEARDGALTIAPQPNGPLRVSGTVEIMANTGRIVLRTVGVNLCRCGHSNTKPICDGTHAKIGFVAE